ncbi:MAG: DUF169 domain-containing protein, partial [Desulfobacterales bacterium]
MAAPTTSPAKRWRCGRGSGCEPSMTLSCTIGVKAAGIMKVENEVVSAALKITAILIEEETRSMNWFEKGETAAIVLAPMQKASFEPDTLVIYGNPAQIMRLTQAWSYITGERVPGHFGGKVECDAYLIAPFRTQAPCVVIPGHGERIFAATQDDEMVFALPGQSVSTLVQGLKEVGKAMGVRYP